MNEIALYTFEDTKYYKDNSNWSNNCLYIDDYLIDIADDAEFENFVLLEGTKVIANSIMESSSFSGCIFVPESLINFGKHNIQELYDLDGFMVDEYNKVYCNDDDGVLFNFEKTELLMAPKEFEYYEYEIPNGVVTIKQEAFREAFIPGYISIPKSVKEIEYMAFYEAETFPYGDKIDIHYEGTEEDWNKIIIGERNDELLNANITFLDIPSIEHTPKTVTIPATCTVDGIEYVICEDCGETIGTPEILKATGHKSSDWIVEKEPTAHTDGKKVKKCTACFIILEETVIPKKATASDDGVIMEYAPNDYDGEVKLHVEESFDGSAFNLIDTQTGATQSFIYDIKMTLNGKEIQPVGKVTIRIPLPGGFKSDNCYIYYVNTLSGKVERIPTTYENGYLVFETDHFSYYAIVDFHEHVFDSDDENCQVCGFDRTDDCDCNCHKDGILSFFFKIILFFQKLFRQNAVCGCGVLHY